MSIDTDFSTPRFPQNSESSDSFIPTYIMDAIPEDFLKPKYTCKDFRNNPKLINKYLYCLSMYGQKQMAADYCGISPTTPRRLMEDSEKFNDAVEEALERFSGIAELSAIHKGLYGTMEDVWYKGQIVGQKRVYDTTLHMAVLKKSNPEYKDGHAGGNAGETGVLLFGENCGSIDEIFGDYEDYELDPIEKYLEEKNKDE